MATPLSLLGILAQARRQLFDDRKRYWTDQDLIDALNDGRRTLYSIKPRIYETTETVTLTAGHRQALPNNSTFLFRFIDNITARSQRGITPVNLELLTRGRPRWRTESPSDEIVHGMYVETSPTHYEVFPPAKAGTQIRISYGKPPEDIVLADRDNASPILLTNEREQAGALIDWTVAKCLMKESDSSPQAAKRALDYMQMAIAKFTGESSGKAKSNPNITPVGSSPPKVNS